MITGAVVLIDSIDQSANLTDVVEIDIEKNLARTATFMLLPSAGITDLVSWVGKSVVIQSNIDSNIKTEFTGVIDTPDYDLETGLTFFTCTDNLQETFETKTKAQIDAIIPAYWSDAAFNDSEGWEYAQERLSTIPSSLDMDELNVIRVTPWAAKATPDFIFTEAEYLYGTLQNDALANRRNIVNAVNISLEYRYVRLKERQQAYSLDDGLVDSTYVCGQIANPYKVPTKARIENSIAGTGWELLTPITYINIPSGGPYSPCGAYSIGNPYLARGASFTLGKRYAQNVTEKYTIRVESADSIAALGEIAINQSASLATDYDLTAWNESLIADGWADYGTPQIDINNDNYVNKDDATERQNAIDTVVNLAKTKILASHKKTQVSFEVPYHQYIDVIHTAQISIAKLTAKGKVSRVIKSIDVLTGRAVCQVTIQLSKKFGVGIPGNEAPPSAPPGLPAVVDSQIVDINLLYHLGGQDPTVYDPNWSGWIVDYTTITEVGHVSYPTEFIIHTPAITLNSIDNIEPSDISLVNVAIPDDVLS